MTKLALLAAISIAVTSALPAVGGIATSPGIAIQPPPPPPPHNVTVDTRGYATGNMAAVHNGAWPKESVWCGQDAYKGGAQTFECGMTDANGVTASCHVFEPNMIATLRSIKSDSQIAMTWDVGGLECTSLSVSDWSGYAPKKQP